jgi:hypothetical protein
MWCHVVWYKFTHLSGTYCLQFRLHAPEDGGGMLLSNTSKFLSGYMTSISWKEYSRTPLCKHVRVCFCTIFLKQALNWHTFILCMEERGRERERSCGLLRRKPDALSTVTFVSFTTFIFGRTHAQVDFETSSLQWSGLNVVTVDPRIMYHFGLFIGQETQKQTKVGIMTKIK